MVVRLGHAVQVVEVEVGVQFRVADVFVGNEVVVVGAGLGGKADHIAGAPSVLGRKRVARYLDLVGVLRGRHIHDSSPALGHIVATLQKVQVVPEVAASKIHEGVILVGRIFTPTRPQQLPVALYVHSGIQRREGKHISEIERKFLNLLALEFSADVRVLCLKQRPTRVYCDLLGGADRQSHIFRDRYLRRVSTIPFCRVVLNPGALTSSV